MKCGHSEPSQEETSYLAKSPYEFTKTYTLELKNPNDAFIKIDGETFQGTWTMVYDEGFNIQFKNFSFFAFSKYMIEESTGKKNYKSQCYSTCVGWYHTLNQNENRWGCYRAEKNIVDPNKVTYLNTKNTLNIVEPGAESTDSNLNNFSINTDLNISASPEENENQSLINSVMNMQFRSIGNKITFNNFVEKSSDKISNRKKMLLNKFGVGYNSTKRSSKLRGRGNKPKNFISSFLEEQGMATLGLGLKLDASFSKHALYITKLNTLKKSWNAALHPNFSNMSIRQLNKFAGIAREKLANEKSEKLLNARLTTNNFMENKMSTYIKSPEEDVSMFPKSFDWKDKLKSAGSQGNCGSCYVYSTIRMIQARLKIKYDHDVDLSVQHALDCSFYNQGCNGGYPFLVMKFANEFQLIPEICKPYMVKF
jgi:cathepsin C